jgi:thiol-disulfide isomerase/thioredoxin
MQIHFSLQHRLLALISVFFLSSPSQGNSPVIKPDEIAANSVHLHGATFKKDLAKNPTVLQFWASWCHRCSTMFSELATLATDYPNISVIAISIDENESDARAYLQKHAPIDSEWSKIIFQWDEKNHIQSKTSVDSVPTVLLLDKDGAILTRTNGHFKKSDLFRLKKELDSVEKGVSP